MKDYLVDLVGAPKNLGKVSCFLRRRVSLALIVFALRRSPPPSAVVTSRSGFSMMAKCTSSVWAGGRIVDAFIKIAHIDGVTVTRNQTWNIIIELFFSFDAPRLVKKVKHRAVVVHIVREHI